MCMTLVDCDHISDKSEIMETNCTTSSLFVAQKPSTYSQRNMEKFWGDYIELVGKSGVLKNKSGGNISETRKDRGKFPMEDLYEVYMNSPMLREVLVSVVGRRR